MEYGKKPKIGIFTTFSNFNAEYSLVTVVRQQLDMFTKYGYEVVLFTLNIFKDDSLVPDKVELRKIIPQLILEPYGSGDLTNIDKDTELAQKAIEENFQDIDVCLTHDIIFINSYLPYNKALRRAMDTKLNHVKWLHWMHSGPSYGNLNGSDFDLLRTLPDKSLLVYMNHTDSLRAAEMYHTMPKNVRTIFNSMDMRSLNNFHPTTDELIDHFDLMSPEILVSYPLSTTRMGEGGKQIRKAIRIVSEIKKRGYSVKFVVPNAHANGSREKLAIEETAMYASELGLSRNELIFTSLFNKPLLEQGVPHEVVRDLFLLSNVFIFPSYSENCPLVLLEAMAGGNILVLNGDFPALKDFGGHNAMYFGFESTIQQNRIYPNGEENYYRDIAILILSEYGQNKAIKAKTDLRRRFNIDYIFKQQLEPAILELYHGK